MNSKTTLQQHTSLKSHSGFKKRTLDDLIAGKTGLSKKVGFKRKVLDFESDSPDNPMIVLDRIHSQVVRRQNADERGYVSCFTCGAKGHWKYMQCGHFRPRQHLATRYHELNCHVQCLHCNVDLEGNLEEYAYMLDKTYSSGTAQHLKFLSDTIVEYMPWEKLLKKFKAVLAVLVAEQEDEIQY